MNSWILSILPSIRLREKPSIAPFKMMLSLPQSSGLKPAPISIKGATLPRIATWPEVAG